MKIKLNVIFFTVLLPARLFSLFLEKAHDLVWDTVKYFLHLFCKKTAEKKALVFNHYINKNTPMLNDLRNSLHNEPQELVKANMALTGKWTETSLQASAGVAPCLMELQMCNFVLTQ